MTKELEDAVSGERKRARAELDRLRATLASMELALDGPLGSIGPQDAETIAFAGISVGQRFARISALEHLLSPRHLGWYAKLSRVDDEDLYLQERGGRLTTTTKQDLATIFETEGDARKAIGTFALGDWIEKGVVVPARSTWKPR